MERTIVNGLGALCRVFLEEYGWEIATIGGLVGEVPKVRGRYYVRG